MGKINLELGLEQQMSPGWVRQCERTLKVTSLVLSLHLKFEVGNMITGPGGAHIVARALKIKQRT